MPRFRVNPRAAAFAFCLALFGAMLPAPQAHAMGGAKIILNQDVSSKDGPNFVSERGYCDVQTPETTHACFKAGLTGAACVTVLPYVQTSRTEGHPDAIIPAGTVFKEEKTPAKYRNRTFVGQVKLQGGRSAKVKIVCKDDDSLSLNSYQWKPLTDEEIAQMLGKQALLLPAKSSRSERSVAGNRSRGGGADSAVTGSRHSPGGTRSIAGR